ncbi:MAG TPA: AlwI family type II restriction endonuclease [Porphyromonadaceae bacterium]|nr:AlwI family type II restriction endonuclease [Porphyromonadaceae bacterium]
MARIDSKILFITTSPRTPARMIPEIELLNAHFTGKKWNTETQTAFMQLLSEENFFNGEGANDPAFSARDRINRAPKSLGFILLSPEIQLTSAGQELVTSKRKEEIFLRQLLKFQLPSPFHIPTEKATNFYVKPYLEMFRLIQYFGSLSFDEIMIFGLQLVDYRIFDSIVAKIEQFRIEKATTELSYKAFRHNQLYAELQVIYQNEIAGGKTKTRESRNRTLDKFLQTKASNMRDYTDALFRYLRATGLVNISYIGKSISIAPEKMTEVTYFLENIDRKPCFIDDEKRYVEYLGNAAIPQLLTDNRDLLLYKINNEFPQIEVEETVTLQQLKDILFDETEKRKEHILQEQVTAIKDYRLYDDIRTVYSQIIDKSLYDMPLMLEWNTWRAMTMLDGGHIKANLKFDDFGNPMSTAQGNIADIVCDYGDFGLTVEVTMQSGQRQYETEGEPVTRHLAKFKKETGKPSYCLFIAPEINEACIAHFYALHKMNISYYGGISTIVPLPLSIFQKMVEDSYKSSYTPQPEQVKRLFDRSNEIAATSTDEKTWYNEITTQALNWLS